MLMLEKFMSNPYLRRTAVIMFIPLFLGIFLVATLSSMAVTFYKHTITIGRRNADTVIDMFKECWY